MAYDLLTSAYVTTMIYPFFIKFFFGRVPLDLIFAQFFLTKIRAKTRNTTPKNQHQQITFRNQ